MATPTFDPNEVSLIIGVAAVTGFASGTFISVTMDTDTYNDYVDAHGKTTRFKINNFNGLLTLTLSQESPTNDVLTALYQADRTIDSGTVPLTLKDNRGSTIISSLGAWVKTLPEVGFGDNNINREWVIRLTNTAWAAGGLKS